MNGDEKKEIIETFRYEFKQAFDPLATTVKEIGKRVLDHGEEIAATGVEIENLRGGMKTLSARLWTLLIGVPALLIGVLGALAYFTR